MTRLPSVVYFNGAWVLGALGVLLAAHRVAVDPDDPWNRMYRRMPRIATSGLDPRGRAVRLLTGAALGFLGIAFVVGGLLGPFGVWTD
jgi:hypothetical protein